VAWAPVIGAAAAFLAVELVVAARYGLHRDELYFLACSRHLAWGYVDQPPLVPAVAWLVSEVIGPFAWALRILPALAGASSVMLAGLMARELGAGRGGQTVATVATATSVELLALFHLLSTAAFDGFFWALVTWLTLRMLRTADDRWMVALGAVTGIALLNKWNVAFLVFALVIGVAAGPDRRLLWSKAALVGAVLCLVIASPDLVWNAQHQWAQVSMLESLHAENSTLGASLTFVPSQLFVVGPVAAVIWTTGLVHLWRTRPWRAVAVGYLVLVGWFVVSGAKPYYLAGFYPVLFSAGGRAAEVRWRARGVTDRVRFWVVLLTLGCIAVLPLVLPLFPESTLPTGSWEGQVNKDLSATVGWPTYVRQIAAIADGLPPDQRSRLVLFTGDYGAAGAIDLYGSRYHLPDARSGHNSYWWWGPGRVPSPSVTIATNVPRSLLLTMFHRVRAAGVVRTPGDVWTEERGDPIYVCTQQYVSWRNAWSSLRHYG
jgi:4-amino-4-deoxy-L-arabinose transferase-like glycosyltransferase